MNPRDKQTLSALADVLTGLLQGQTPLSISSVAYDGDNEELSRLSNAMDKLVRSLAESNAVNNGKIVAGVKAFRDISRLKHSKAEGDNAQAALKVHANFLQGLLNAIPNPVFYKNAQLLYIGCNTAFAEYMGLTIQDIIGKSVYDLAPPDLARSYNKKDVELLTHSRHHTQIYEAEVKHADGSMRNVIFNKAVFFEDNGAVGGLIGVIIDITQRKTLEKEREHLIGELQDALAQVKQLSGLLPICSACKKIRDDKGYWSQIETYITEHSEALFTHSICPGCAKKLYPQYYKNTLRDKGDKSD
jgi:PAS domain S-box-containing protein